MIPIFKWTLWQRRFGVLGWSIGIFAFIFINMIVYPSFKDQAAELEKSFESLPDAAVQLFGGSTDFFSPIGFLNSQIFFLMLPLLLAIYAIGLGSGLLAREEQDKTIESLLARPVSRGKLLLAKALAGSVMLLAVTIVALLTTVVTAQLVDLDVAASKIALATLVCFMLSLSIGAIAYMLTATGRARGAALGIATLVALGGYLVDSLAGTVDWLKIPAKIFPFHFYKSEAILSGTYDWVNVLFYVGTIVVGGVLAWVSFRRRDLA
jgi:ABC-2 type transport system permease protein